MATLAGTGGFRHIAEVCHSVAFGISLFAIVCLCAFTGKAGPVSDDLSLI